MVTTKRENIIDPALFSDMNKRIESAKESVEQNVEWVDGVTDNFSLNANTTLRKFIKFIKIPEGPTQTSPQCCYQFSALEEVYLPNSITRIGEMSFQECTALKAIHISDKLTNITAQAFQGCTALTSIVLPSTMMSITDNAFTGCDALMSIIINRPKDSIAGAPWGATNAEIIWNE